MTTRIEARFAKCRQEGRAALVTYVMAGDPDPETSLEILESLPKAGADIVEFGLPFTDPDGGRSRYSGGGLASAKVGQNTVKTLELVRRFGQDDEDTPVILMGYFNPIHTYGRDRFLVDAKEAGVDGLIVVDLPPEEDDELCLPALKAGLAFIRLATPTTDDKRLPGGARQHRRVRLLRFNHRHHRHGDPRFRQGRHGGGADQAAYAVAGRRGLRRQERRARGGGGARGRRCRRRIGAD